MKRWNESPEHDRLLEELKSLIVIGTPLTEVEEAPSNAVLGPVTAVFFYSSTSWKRNSFSRMDGKKSPTRDFV